MENYQLDDSNNLLTDLDDSLLSKNQTELSSTSSSTYYKGSLSVNLKDSISNDTLTNKTVYFNVNNANFNATTDNGLASIYLNLNPGKYTIFSYFEGDDNYEGCNLTYQFEILPTIKSNGITGYYKGTQYTAQFFNNQGGALANTWVKINVNGKDYSKKTDNNGRVYLSVTLNPGSYKVTSTDPVTGYNITTNLNVLATVSSSNVKQVQGQNKKFSVKFLKSNGQPLAKKYVKIKFNGKTHKYKTNSKGFVTISLKNFKKGTYKMICTNKDGLSKTFTVKIYKKKASTSLSSKSYTFYPNDKRVIKVKLSTALADTSNSGKIIKIKINGKTYSKKTDSNGEVSLDLSSFSDGKYSVEYVYSGNTFFKASKLKKTVTIFETTQTKVTVKSTTSFGYGAGTLLKVAYTAGRVPLANRDVTLTLNGVSYVETTDSNGIVSIPINLNIGTYAVDYHTDDESRFNGTSGSFDINVFKRSDSKVIWKCGNSYKDNLQTFKVLVTDLNGNPTSGGSVSLTIDGETYTGTVKSNGYATIKTSVPIGSYKVSVKFNGNNNLLSSSASESVTVKLSKFGSGLNEKNAKALSAYLKSSSHCKVGTAAIKKLVKTLTEGLTSKTDKAKAIFNYVRDTLGYSLYYNTHYGASGTLKYKKGNCVDHSHLLVAMFRTAGLPARYVHGACKFNSGHTYGHVWTQVKIGKYWVVADATSYSNDLGKIKNWNTKSYSIHAKYSSLPF